MLVRLVERHRQEGVWFVPGDVLDVEDDEALILLRDGVAVPAESADVFARETR